MTKELVKTDLRYDGHRLSGVTDHLSWPKHSIDRKKWLFAFSFYLKSNNDDSYSFSAGPGRIGSNEKHLCPSPQGKGYVITDDSSYNTGTTHEYGADLASFVDSVLSATGAMEVDLVGHSMGGFVVRSYLSFYGGDSKVRRVLLISSPVLGAPWSALVGLFPVGHPSWMDSHEIAEVDAGPICKILFSRCGGTEGDTGTWPSRLMAHEELHPPAVELHVMNGNLDMVGNYLATDHPQADSHEVVPTADHYGILLRDVTVKHVSKLLGGWYP